MHRSEIILVTGGLGFIGKHFVRSALDQGCFVKNVDKVSYAADLKVREEFESHPNYRFIHEDVVSLGFLPECDVIVHFAAESHVDNAISSNTKFCETNFLGTQRLLEMVRFKQEAERPLFIQISTDEVYGDIAEGAHDPTDRLVPSNPYSATKAAADMLVMSWGRTYRIPWIIARPTNNYGTHQYPEKLIPKSGWRMKRGLPAIMHGDGSYIRSWLHVEDTASALFTLINKGDPGTIYNIGSGTEFRNIDVLRMIAEHLGVPEEKAWTMVSDRPGQDIRYSLNDDALRALGWAPSRVFTDEIRDIIDNLDFARFA